MKTFKRLFLLDDRTGLWSTSKLLRWISWFITIQFVIACEVLVFFDHYFTVTPSNIQILDMIKNFLLIITPSMEGSYQFNRHTKIKNGKVEPLKAEEDSNKVEIVRNEI